MPFIRQFLMRFGMWLVLSTMLILHPAHARDTYETRVFVVDLGSYLIDLKKQFGPLGALKRNAPVTTTVQTERVIKNIVSTRQDARTTTVFLVWDKRVAVKIRADKLDDGIKRLRRTALQFGAQYKSDPTRTPPAIVLTLVEAMDSPMRKYLSAAQARGIPNPDLHMVWIGGRWSHDYVDANGSLNSDPGENVSDVVYPDACMGTPKAQRTLYENRIARDWTVQFELHLIPDQPVPSELSVRALMHRFGHFEYTQPAVGQPFESKSTQSYLGTFMAGCSLEPKLEPAVPSFQLGKDDQSGICKPINQRLRPDPQFIIRCDEFDAYHASISLRRTAGTPPTAGPATVFAVKTAGKSLATTKVDLLFSATGHGRSMVSAGHLGTWITALPTTTPVDLRVRIKTATTCGVVGDLYIEFDIADSRFNFRGRYHAVISSLPPCNSHNAAFVTVPIGVLNIL